VVTGKEAYETSMQFYTGFQPPLRPWEALPSAEKVRWEEIAFEQEQKERKDAT
jgi:hypothetical protein